jgi:hypothetical protein
MSNDFKKVLVKDDRLMVTDSLNYAVVKSGQNVTNVRFPAISTNVNSLNFVIPFPSESTVLDREVYLKTTTQYLLKFNAPLQGSEIFSNDPNSGNTPAQYVIGYQCPLIYGYNISVGSFSSQRTMDTIQVQLNNNVNTINVSDVLPALLRCADAIDWEKENMTASGVDRLARPLDETVLVTNSNLSGYEDCHGGKFVGNGGFEAVLQSLTSATPFNADGSPNLYNYGVVGGTDPVPGNVGTDTFLLTITSTEPLVAPPFIWNKTMSNRQGLYGLQNAQIVCNYGNPAKAIKLASGRCIADPNSLNTSGQNFQYSNALRDVFQTWPVGANVNSPLVTVTRNAVVNAELQMKYITPHGNDIVPVRNVIPLLEFPRFITTGLGSIPLAYNTAYAVNAEDPPVSQQNYTQNQIIPTTAVLASQTYTFNQIPDKLLIFVRPDQAYRNSSVYNDWVFAITNIVIQWNNHAGILANASQEQLFHMSKESGSNQDFLAFQGVSNVVKDKQSGPMSFNFMALGVNSGTQAAPSLGIQNRAVFPSPGQATTVGSYLMLDLAKHLELGESFNAPGSLGSFQLQFNVTIENYITSSIGGIENDTQNTTSSVDVPLNGITPEIVVIPVNSGLMVTERGQTSCYTGILTKSDVLDASLQEPYGHMELKRIVGHGQGDSSKALPCRIRPKPKQGKHVMPNGSIMDNRLM